MHVAAGGCKEDQFACASGDECTINEYMCDGENDCADGSDENAEMCRKYRKPDNSNIF